MSKPNPEIRIAKTAKDFIAAKKLILEYADWLNIDLSFQDFENEINYLQKIYAEPTGGLTLAIVNDKAVGVAGIRKFEEKVCELKRMYVKEPFRNIGIGKLILQYSIDYARKLNYNSIKLDTDSSMKAAIKLYLAHGFKETEPYRFNPFETVRYFELGL